MANVVFCWSDSRVGPEALYSSRGFLFEGRYPSAPIAQSDGRVGAHKSM